MINIELKRLIRKIYVVYVIPATIILVVTLMPTNPFAALVLFVGTTLAGWKIWLN